MFPGQRMLRSDIQDKTSVCFFDCRSKLRHRLDQAEGDVVKRLANMLKCSDENMLVS